nr:hypothetical protein CFP56_11190 [Quercus suber]
MAALRNALTTLLIYLRPDHFLTTPDLRRLDSKQCASLCLPCRHTPSLCWVLPFAHQQHQEQQNRAACRHPCFHDSL